VRAGLLTPARRTARPRPDPPFEFVAGSAEKRVGMRLSEHRQGSGYHLAGARDLALNLFVWMCTKNLMVRHERARLVCRRERGRSLSHRVSMGEDFMAGDALSCS